MGRPAGGRSAICPRPMATRRKTQGGGSPRRTGGARNQDARGEPGRVVRRPKEERKGLPPDLEAFARSDERRLRRPGPRGPSLKDPRPVALVPGVSNRDARAVCDARLERLESVKTGGDEGALEDALAEVVLLGLWRGRALTGFDALVENVLSFPIDEARRLAEAGASRLGLPAEPLRPELVAAWFRAEAGLLEERHEARVRAVRAASGEAMIEVTVSGLRAAEAFHAIGRRMTPLVRDHQPEGVPPRRGREPGREPTREGLPPRRDRDRDRDRD